MRNPIICLLTLIGLGSRALALPAQPDGTYLRTAFAVEDGVPSNIVTETLQTRNGFLWLCTPHELTRFDGRHFYSIPFPPGISQLPYALAEAPDGALWVGTSGGLMRIPSTALDQFGPIPAEIYHNGTGPTDSVESLQFAIDGTLFVGTAAGLFRFNHGAFTTILPGLMTSRITTAKGGHLLIITQRGFVEWDGTRIVEHADLPAQLGVPADKIFGVMEARSGVRWFSTSTGVARQNPDGAVVKIPSSGSGLVPEAYRTYEDAQGIVWVAHAGGLLRVVADRLERIGENIQVKSIYGDRDGNLWVGTNGQGLIRYRRRLVHMLTTTDGLPTNVVMTVLSAHDGKLWVGNNCGGLSWLDGSRFRTYSEKDGLSNSCVASLAEDLNHDLWAGTFGGGVFRLHDGHFTRFSKKEGLPSDTVRSVLAARDGSVWIADGSVVGRIQEGRIRLFGPTEGLTTGRPANFFQDRQGVIWVGCSKGISRLQGERFVTVRSEPLVHRMLGEDASGRLYVWVDLKGVCRLDGSRLIGNGASRSMLFSMLRSREEMWFAGDGISRLAADALQTWEREPEAPRDIGRYSTADGMTTVQSSGLSPNMAISPDGKLWIATVGGLAVLDIAKLPIRSPKPSIYMEEITVGKASRAPGNGLVLAPGTRHVELRFDAIELQSPEKIQFQYRLDGVDSDWLDAGANLTAVYTNFALGTHQFHVRACNRDGVWDRAGVTYSVTQQPFFYETRLFQFVVVCAIGLLVAAAYQYRLRQVAAQMNARAAERTRLARDLHDTLLQTIQASQLMALAALRIHGNPAETTKNLERLHSWLDRAVLEARASLDALRTSVTDDNTLAEDLRRAGEQSVAGTPIQFSLTTLGAAREIQAAVRDELYQIGCEAIRNACQHSRASKVEVQITYARNLVLQIRDNGEGIPEEVVAHGKAGHFGLQGMRERAERIGGKLSVTTAPGAGTAIEVSLPGKRWKT